MEKQGCWVANVSDGSTHTERLIDDVISPWRRLKTYCDKNRSYITNLRMTVGKKTVACPSGAIGYWHANAMPAVQGVNIDHELHEWHGIGWVENDIVKIIWGAIDPRTHQVIFWNDIRQAQGQNQIIWSQPEIPADPEAPLPHKSAEVRGAKELLQRMSEQ